ncbi:MAG TPA: hypothetical protein VGN72_14440 [Tepidisphaeraceae bacterium]|jgi:lysylphosphatidylglycerol synthetase-like protein (DUF2156 family)|nr:hypothetical protein [Tepidisphaeraceae bacterium]
MNTTWQSIKLWTKLILMASALLYMFIFVYNNSNKPVKIWWWFNREPDTSVLVLTLGTFLTGVITAILVRTIWKTWRQIRKSTDRSRTNKLEREMADMKAKAARLQVSRPDVDPDNNTIA